MNKIAAMERSFHATSNFEAATSQQLALAADKTIKKIDKNDYDKNYWVNVLIDIYNHKNNDKETIIKISNKLGKLLNPN